jgi:ABC-type transporter Mla subunit MlaD
MADDLELTIVISAIDDASAVLQTLAAEITDDFNAIAAQTQATSAQIDGGIGSIGPMFGELVQDATDLSAAFSQAYAVVGALDDLLVSLEQDAAGALLSLGQLSTAMGSAMDIGGGGGAGPSSDLMGQFAGATPGAAGPVQVIQNNTFNGILDPGAIRDQIIPELERAVARGATSLTSS